MKPTHEDREHLEQIEKRISSLESSIFAMDESLKREEASLLFMERMSEAMTLHGSKMQSIQNRLPTEHLPVIPNQLKLPSNALAAVIAHSADNHTAHPNQQQNERPKPKANIKRKPTVNNEDN